MRQCRNILLNRCEFCYSRIFFSDAKCFFPVSIGSLFPYFFLRLFLAGEYSNELKKILLIFNIPTQNIKYFKAYSRSISDIIQDAWRFFVTVRVWCLETQCTVLLGFHFIFLPDWNIFVLTLTKGAKFCTYKLGYLL